MNLNAYRPLSDPETFRDLEAAEALLAADPSIEPFGSAEEYVAALALRENGVRVFNQDPEYRARVIARRLAQVGQ